MAREGDRLGMVFSTAFFDQGWKSREIVGHGAANLLFSHATPMPRLATGSCPPVSR